PARPQPVPGERGGGAVDGLPDPVAVAVVGVAGRDRPAHARQAVLGAAGTGNGRPVPRTPRLPCVTMRGAGRGGPSERGRPRPAGEFRAEAEALRLFDGRGAARLLAADLGRGALLLERLEPGTPLTDIADAAETATIAAGVMRRLWRPAPPGHPFPSVADWVRGMAERAPRLAAGGPIPAGWLDEALTLFAGLDAAGVEPV